MTVNIARYGSSARRPLSVLTNSICFVTWFCPASCCVLVRIPAGLFPCVIAYWGSGEVPGGYRWFCSLNVVPIKRWRGKRVTERVRAS
jgi:hypothetical protein